MKQRFIVWAIVGSAVLASTATFFAVKVGATGIPAKEALTYTGYLEDGNGTPITNEQMIGLAAYDNSTAGTKFCEVEAKPITPVGGRFQMQLPDTCVAAVSAHPELWVEVSVGAIPLGRTKLGAVPYAVEAEHAARATSADSATTALSATKASSSDSATHAASADTSGNATGDITPKSVKIGGSGPIRQNWWEYGVDDGKTGTGIDFHGGLTQTDYTARLYRPAGDTGDFNIANRGGALAFWTNDNLRMQVDAEGNVTVNGTITARNVPQPSDVRLKGGVRSLEHALNDLGRLRGVRFNWLEDGTPSIGVVAQEVERVYPELVFAASDGTKAVDYGKLVAVVIEASKELAALDAALSARIDRLEQHMDRVVEERNSRNCSCYSESAE